MATAASTRKRAAANTTKRAAQGKSKNGGKKHPPASTAPAKLSREEKREEKLKHANKMRALRRDRAAGWMLFFSVAGAFVCAVVASWPALRVLWQLALEFVAAAQEHV